MVTCDFRPAKRIRVKTDLRRDEPQAATVPATPVTSQHTTLPSIWHEPHIGVPLSWPYVSMAERIPHTEPGAGIQTAHGLSGHGGTISNSDGGRCGIGAAAPCPPTATAAGAQPAHNLSTHGDAAG